MPLSTFRIFDVMGNPLRINANEITRLPRRRSSLEATILKRVCAVYSAVRDVIIVSGPPENAASEFENSFLRVESPESDLLIWEAVVATLSMLSKRYPALIVKLFTLGFFTYFVER